MLLWWLRRRRRRRRRRRNHHNHNNNRTRGRYWVYEGPYEMEGDQATAGPDGRGARGPELGRLAVENRKPKLFEGWRFHLHGSFNKPGKAELIRLLGLGGAEIAEKIPAIADEARAGKRRVGAAASKTRPLVVIVDAKPPPAALVSMCAARRLPPPVDPSWVLDCISRYKVPELRPPR